MALRIGRGGDGDRGPLWLVTKLEPGGARTLFPCWDEPAFKAVFKLALTHNPDVVALANAAPLRTRTLKSGAKVTELEATPPMSTFLFALALGHFTSVARRTPRGLRLQIWTLPQDIARVEFPILDVIPGVHRH